MRRVSPVLVCIIVIILVSGGCQSLDELNSRDTDTPSDSAVDPSDTGDSQTQMNDSLGDSETGTGVPDSAADSESETEAQLADWTCPEVISVDCSDEPDAPSPYHDTADYSISGYRIVDAVGSFDMFVGLDESGGGADPGVFIYG